MKGAHLSIKMEKEPLKLSLDKLHVKPANC